MSKYRHETIGANGIHTFLRSPMASHPIRVHNMLIKFPEVFFVTNFSDSCFLCGPDPKLVIKGDERLFSMVGLGPLTNRYFVLACLEHVRSLADAFNANPTIAESVTSFREFLQADGPPLLMTEHGRVPTCLEGTDAHDAHCFHAHALLFETQKDIRELSESYFLEAKDFNNLADALEYSTNCQNYHLLSPRIGNYTVFSGGLNVPRQFFRKMVAHINGNIGDADWRSNPLYSEAVERAYREREKLGLAL